MNIPDSYQLGFCDRYQYPQEVKQHFARIMDQILDVLMEYKVISVVVFGSTSRGELTYKVEDGKLVDLYSDYEFLIVVQKKPDRESVERLKREFAANAEEWQISSNLFHIEFMLNSILRFYGKAPFLRRLAQFELYSTGLVIYGRDLLKEYPFGGKITTSNLDFGDLNGLVVERLWWQLFHLTCDLEKGEVAKPETLIYFLARNSIELLTIFLPNDGILLSGYQKRLDYFQEHYAGYSPFQSGFSSFMQACVDVKLKLAIENNLLYFYENFVIGYLHLIGYLAGVADDALTNELKVEVVIEPFIKNERNYFPRSIYWRSRQLLDDLRFARRVGIPSAPRWALMDKQRLMVGFLAYLHAYLVSVLQGEANYKYLVNAQRMNAKIQGRDIPTKEGSDPLDWKLIADSFVSFFLAWRIQPRIGKDGIEHLRAKSIWS